VPVVFQRKTIGIFMDKINFYYQAEVYTPPSIIIKLIVYKTCSQITFTLGGKTIVIRFIDIKK